MWDSGVTVCRAGTKHGAGDLHPDRRMKGHWEGVPIPMSSGEEWEKNGQREVGRRKPHRESATPAGNGGQAVTRAGWAEITWVSEGSMEGAPASGTEGRKRYRRKEECSVT